MILSDRYIKYMIKWSTQFHFISHVPPPLPALICNLLTLSFQGDYCIWGHLDRVDQPDYRKIIIHSKKVGCGSISNNHFLLWKTVIRWVTWLVCRIIVCFFGIRTFVFRINREFIYFTSKQTGLSSFLGDVLNLSFGTNVTRKKKSVRTIHHYYCTRP